MIISGQILECEGSIEPFKIGISNEIINPRFLLGTKYDNTSAANIFLPKRNLGFFISFEMPVSKIRPQYGSIDPSHSNIRPLMMILWQNIYLYT